LQEKTKDLITTQNDKDAEKDEEQNGPITVLPGDMLLQIIILLGENPNDIFRAGLVCKDWHRCSTNETLWVILYNNHQYSWDTVEGHGPLEPKPKDWASKAFATSSKILEFFDDETKKAKATESEKIAVLTWKQKFIFQHKRNSAFYNKKVATICEKMYQRPKTKLNLIAQVDPWQVHKKINLKHLPFQVPFVKRVYKLPMFGEGLDSSAKKLLYQMMWGEETPFRINCLYPGVEGIGSGVGFSINDKQLNLAAMYIQRTIPKQLGEFFRTADGLIFVTDSTVEFTKVKEELDSVLVEYSKPDAPLLVFSCTKSIMGNYKPIEIAQQLELTKLTRKWCVTSIKFNNLQSAYKGLDWLTNALD